MKYKLLHRSNRSPVAVDVIVVIVLVVVVVVVLVAGAFSLVARVLEARVEGTEAVCDPAVLIFNRLVDLTLENLLDLFDGLIGDLLNKGGVVSIKYSFVTCDVLKWGVMVENVGVGGLIKGRVEELLSGFIIV